MRRTGSDDSLDLAIDSAVEEITRAVPGDELRVRVLARIAGAQRPAVDVHRWRWILTLRPWPQLAGIGAAVIVIALLSLWQLPTTPDREGATISSPPITAGVRPAPPLTATPGRGPAEPPAPAAEETHPAGAAPHAVTATVLAAGGTPGTPADAAGTAVIEPLSPPAPLALASIDLAAIDLAAMVIDELEITPLDMEPLSSGGLQN